MANDKIKGEKKPKSDGRPTLEEAAARLSAIRDELDEREQAVLDAEAMRDAAKQHFENLHAAVFGSEYGIVAGGRGSETVDENDKPVPPNWPLLMGDIPDPEEADDDAE